MNANNRPFCQHCNKQVALNHKGHCTNIGCGKSLEEPVQLKVTLVKAKQRFFQFGGQLRIN